MAALNHAAWQWHVWHEMFRPVHCRAVGCPERTSTEFCPEHGIAAYYDRCMLAGRSSGD